VGTKCGIIEYPVCFVEKDCTDMPNMRKLGQIMARSLKYLQNRFNLTDVMIFRNRWWQHLFFWALVIFILLNIFKTSDSIEKIDLIYTLLFLVPLISVVYLNLYLAIPHLLRKEKYVWYTISLLLLGISGALWLYLLFDRWVDIILPHYYFISYYTVFQLLIFTGSVLMLTTLIKLSRSWFMMLRIERLNTRNQLKTLQQQINPHFLLNSLQTIYALSLEHSSHTPKAILQLSDILKYTLYDTEQPRVKLEKEVALISDYVDMFRFRIDPERVSIRFDVAGACGSLVIAPMLLIPFVENCFKHGLSDGPGQEEISISLNIGQDTIEFTAMNGIGSKDPPPSGLQGGIGIENTTQRLQLIYPGRHRLRINEAGGRFRVSLQIKLDTWDPANA
jgi:sensor histidine kinase YesM